MALDTGSTRTVVDPDRLSSVGVEVDERSVSLPITTASGVSEAQLVNVPRLQTLGSEWVNIAVARYRLPSETRFDGLLGLDLLRDARLTIDFRSGSISAVR